ncbi:MAG: cupin domain-containing protein [Chloroflexi bacterium]|nr:cupin domain-containing protein [Chloroflexota bacterium]
MTGAVVALLGASAVYAATNTVIAVGTMAHFDAFGGPATVTTRSLQISPNEVLPWHYHPGLAYTTVKSGTLTVADGCGGETVYEQGAAFIEHAGRIHRGRAGATAVETVQTFIVPAGSPFSVNATGCGAPMSIDECASGGWAAFTHPRAFANQGDCIQHVIGGTRH